MAQKVFTIEGVGEVPIYKHRKAKTVRIRISGSDIRVTIPTWMPYKAAVLYVSQKAIWINQNRTMKQTIYSGMPIGKKHHLKVEETASTRFSSKRTDSALIVRIPASHSMQGKESQTKLTRYIQTVLQSEAEELIIPRVRQLAQEHNFVVNKIEIKNLKSRWGSCSSHGDLAFSLFLIQLPWDCIDYVMYHELAHTVHLNHSREFWSLVASFVPNYKEIRHTMKSYSPHITVS